MILDALYIVWIVGLLIATVVYIVLSIAGVI